MPALLECPFQCNYMRRGLCQNPHKSLLHNILHWATLSVVLMQQLFIWAQEDLITDIGQGRNSTKVKELLFYPSSFLPQFIQPILSFLVKSLLLKMKPEKQPLPLSTKSAVLNFFSQHPLTHRSRSSQEIAFLFTGNCCGLPGVLWHFLSSLS